MPVYGLMADLHCHNWSAFAEQNGSGLNSRLMHITNEIERCCRAVRNRGGDMVVIAGDIFHTRGAISPSVFNYLADILRNQCEFYNMRFLIMPGNHDLEGKTLTGFGSATDMLQDVGEMMITVWHPVYISTFRNMVLIPWNPDYNVVLSLAENARFSSERSDFDLIIHAGIDGVIPGMPDHGLTVDKLADLGYRRVFAGHYHNHKDLGRGVYSIGAPTHHTWSDVGAHAGWMIVDDDKVEFFASEAPRFVNVTGEEDEEEFAELVHGNYARLRMGEASASEVANIRTLLIDKLGAKGVLIESAPPSMVGLRSGLSSSGGSLDASLLAYCTTHGIAPDVQSAASMLLAEAMR
jgi:DNA repair exonuclease SbcCD nuclease subunit